MTHAEAWIYRCSDRLIALNVDKRLDGADWDDIAADLWERRGQYASAEAAAYAFAAAATPLNRKAFSELRSEFAVADST